MSALAETAAETAGHAEERQYTIAVDFDGVLHQYVTPWEAADVIPDPPVEGAIEWLTNIVGHYRVVIFTTRGKTPEGRHAVLDWIAEHGGPAGLTVTAEKGPALVYIDDRAWRFNGTFPAARTIRYARPWKTGDERRTSARDAIRAAGQRQHALEEKQARLKREVRDLRHLLILEVLAGRGFTELEAEGWADAHDGKFEEAIEAIEAARAERVR